MKRRRINKPIGMIDIEKSSFNPLVFTTTGRMAPECNRETKGWQKK